MTPLSDLSLRVAAWLDALPPERLRALATDYADGLASDGLTVYRAAEDAFVPIAPSLSPEAIADETLAALTTHARHLLSATVKAARWTIDGAGREHGARLYHGFTPLERECLARDPERLSWVSTARVDYFWGPRGNPLALELNATIPAMQGYSDLAAHRWLRTVAPDRAEQAIRAAGSNTADLLASLVAHYERLGGRARTPSILIVSRRGDAQLGELRHYERAFNAAGHRTRHVWVDEVELDGSGRLRARGEPFDLLYRHIFARRVDPDSTLARLLRDPGPNVVLNPVLSPLEVKGVLAILSERPEALELDDDERATVASVVPWTRLFVPGPTTTPDGTRVADLADWVAAHPERLVIKRSWDYGGKGVVLGPEVERAEWSALAGRASVDENAWVVQEFVPPRPVRHLLVGRAPDGTVEPAWRELFVDISGYANLGVAPRPRGGVCRASSSKIVNIALGGGVAPLIPASVLETIFPSRGHGA